MTALTFGGKPVATPEATQPTPITDVPWDNILVIFRLIAMNLEARRELAWAVQAVREIDVEALSDPALADHPRRPAMLRLYEDRCQDERLAVLKLAELNAALASEWNALPAATKNRYGFTTIIGADPDQDILLVLWCDDRGLGLLVPFPQGWAIPQDISHRALDPTMGIREYSAEELLNAPVAPF